MPPFDSVVTGYPAAMADTAPTPDGVIPYPGETAQMSEQPRDEMRDYVGRDLLAGKRALITGGDSGIGRAVAVAFAKEGADVAIAYLEEHSDAEHTAALVDECGRRSLLLPGDLADAEQCRAVVDRTVGEFGGLDIVVNNVAYQNPTESLTDISDEQWRRTFAVNIDSFFHVTKAALAHLPDGGAIINTSSINGLRGNKTLMDYSATKGAVLALTYSLAQSLAGSQDPRQLCGARTGVDAAHPGHDGCGQDRRISVLRRLSAARPSPTRSPRRMCSSPPGRCRRTTAVRCSPPSAARRCPADRLAAEPLGHPAVTCSNEPKGEYDREEQWSRRRHQGRRGGRQRQGQGGCRHGDRP